MESLRKTEIFEFLLSRREREAIERLIKSEGCKEKFKILREARVEVKIEVEIEEKK